MQEFYLVLRKIYEVRQRLNTLLNEIYNSYSNAIAIYGLEVLNEGAKSVPGSINVIAGTRNVMGVVVPSMEVTEIPSHTPALPPEVSDIQLKRKELIESVIALAEYEKELILLGAEIRRVKRIVVMLEKVLIPRLLNTIRYLLMKFDEMEREERVRSMKIKSLLLQRGGFSHS